LHEHHEGAHYDKKKLECKFITPRSKDLWLLKLSQECKKNAFITYLLRKTIKSAKIQSF